MSEHDRDIISGGPCRPFLALSKALCPHFEILSEKKSAWFEFPLPCYIDTLYNGTDDYQNVL